MVSEGPAYPYCIPTHAKFVGGPVAQPTHKPLETWSYVGLVQMIHLGTMCKWETHQ